MQFKRAIAATVATSAAAVPTVALAATTTDSAQPDPAVSKAHAHHMAAHRKAARRNVRLARIAAQRSGKAVAASYEHGASTRSLAELQRSNERLRALVTRLGRENDLVRRLKPTLSAIAFCESHQRPDAVNATGTYRGLFQFDQTAWSQAGGSGDPARASVREQYLRAAITYMRRGAAPWPVCGR